MGNKSTVGVQKCIFVDFKSTIYKVPYPNKISSEELTELIKSKTNTARSYKIILQDKSGKIIPISCSIEQNTDRTAYKLETLSCDVYGMELSVETDSNSAKNSNDIDKCFKELKELKQMVSKISNKNEAGATRKSINLEESDIYPKFHLSPDTIKHLKTPSFNIWHWETNEMLSILEFMFEELGIVEEFKIENITLKRWLMCIKSNYRDNPFHNFRHCFCVAQMMYGLIHLCELKTIMSQKELGILLIAAICHDLDHPGFNNLYQVNARTELAIRYNDISPLENHHCAVAFQIVSKPRSNIFENVSNEVYKEIRIGIVKLILATDMARHKDIITSFQNNLINFDSKNVDHMDSLKMVLIKCCDISNECRPFEVSERWVDCLLEEYFIQSDREKKEGLPVANYMDRELVTKPNSQVGFIKYVLLPMFESILKLFPEIREPIIKPLEKSFARYEKLKQMEEQK